MRIIIRLFITTISVFAAAYIIPYVSVDTWTTAFVTAIVLGLLNTFLKPILIILTLPINILTLGLFTFVINLILILLASDIVPGFHVDNFVGALLFGLAVSLINSILTEAAS